MIILIFYGKTDQYMIDYYYITSAVSHQEGFIII